MIWGPPYFLKHPYTLFETNNTSHLNVIISFWGPWPSWGAARGEGGFLLWGWDVGLAKLQPEKGTSVLPKTPTELPKPPFISRIPSRSLTWNLKMMVSKRNLLFQGLIFRFHVKLQGCMYCLCCACCTTVENLKLWQESKRLAKEAFCHDAFFFWRIPPELF